MKKDWRTTGRSDPTAIEAFQEMKKKIRVYPGTEK